MKKPALQKLDDLGVGYRFKKAPQFYLSESQQIDLERFWFAVNEMAELLPPPESESGGLVSLRIICSSVGDLFSDLSDKKIPDAIAAQIMAKGGSQ